MAMGQAVVDGTGLKSAERTCHILNNTTHDPHVPALTTQEHRYYLAIPQRQVIPVPVNPSSELGESNSSTSSIDNSWILGTHSLPAVI